MALRPSALPFALLLALAPATHQARPHDVKGSTMRPHSFRDPVRLLTLRILDHGLTYEPSDMGKEADRVPTVLAFQPSVGLFLLDPGSSTLQRFSSKGERVFAIALRPALSLTKGANLEALALRVDEHGTSTLALREGEGGGIVTAMFDASGKLLVLRRPKCLDGAESVYPDLAGITWGLRRNGPARQEMIACSPEGLARTRLPLPEGSLAAPVPGHGALLIGPEGNASLLRPDGTRSALAWKADENTLAAVPGSGRITGVLVQTEAPKGPDERGHYDDGATLRILSIDEGEGGETLRLIGSAYVSLGKGEFDRKHDRERTFELVDLRGLSFDEDGNLYVIARTGPTDASFVVYRFELEEQLRRPPR